MAKRPQRRSSSAATRAQKETTKGAIQIALALCAVAVGAFIFMKVSASQRDLDPETLCPSDPESITVLLVDVTRLLSVMWPLLGEHGVDVERFRSSVAALR